MKTLKTLRFVAIAAALSGAIGGVAAAETFRNGQSLYGQPASEGANARLVDVGATKYANVTYGETIVFQGTNGQKFSWTFNGLDGRSWDLAQFAPAGFVGKDYRVYVTQNPLYRRR
jgi:hypothetical protein